MAKIILSLQVALALIVVFVSAHSLARLYYAGVFNSRAHQSAYSNDVDLSCGAVDVGVSSAELASMMGRIDDLHTRVKKRMVDMNSAAEAQEALMFSDVLLSLDVVKSYLLRLKLSADGGANKRQPKLGGTLKVAGGGDQQVAAAANEEDDQLQEELEKDADAAPLVDFFLTEEIKKYLRMKENRNKRRNFMGANMSIGAIGHACVSMKSELEEYMDYDVGDLCKDDWPLAQRLMVHGCDPLPRRRCLARAPPYYQKPLPMNQSLWALPDDRNVRWARYACRNFQCLQNGTRRGFSKCSSCFKLQEHEAPRWITNSSLEADFLISHVLALKPGEIRVGLDFSVGVGTFAARMLEHNVTIVSSTLNLGAPFNEFIALRGLIPLYISLNQRLPFFDNTLDIIHTTLFLDGWIDLQFLDFVVFDWDRVLRPGGLLWIDKFFCQKKDLDDYLYMFLQLRYKKHKWVVTPKYDKVEKDQLYFSALLEKPARPF